MIDIIYTLFTSVVHAIETIINIIVTIPNYVTTLFVYVNMLPTFILAPLTIAITAIVIIHIKRLVF